MPRCMLSDIDGSNQTPLIGLLIELVTVFVQSDRSVSYFPTDDLLPLLTCLTKAERPILPARGPGRVLEL